jgi:outer membrane protein OmpA-like peptidoglycan-associated protein
LRIMFHKQINNMKKLYTLLIACSILTGNCLISQEMEYKYLKENLGERINSSFDELMPLISPDGKTLFFCREGDTSNLGYKKWKDDQDIWFSMLQDDGTWSKAENIGLPLNNEYPNAVLSVTPDGNTLLLLGAYDETGKVSPGVSMTHRTTFGWAFPKKLNIKNLKQNSNYASYFLSNDSKTLLLSIENQDSYGDRDLYVSFRQPDDSWSEPMNMGADINSDKKDASPFLAADGKTLYFASLGHGGYGGEDLFVCTRLDDSWKNWTKPMNLGPEINTSGKDYYYIIPAKADYSYLVSSENSMGLRDIFRLKIETKIKPKPVVLVYGKVRNAKTKEPIDARVLYELLPEGKESGMANSNPQSGDYKITLQSGFKFGFRAEAKGFISVNDFLDLTEITEYTEIERNLDLVPIETGEIVRLNNIFFDYDKSTLKEESYPELNRVVTFLADNPTVEIEISGHTDARGSEEYNLKLSHDRSRSVVEYLISQGITTNRLTYRGYGESVPLATNDTEEGMEMNRRVEFKILKK